jgi:hypothetical protein
MFNFQQLLLLGLSAHEGCDECNRIAERRYKTLITKRRRNTLFRGWDENTITDFNRQKGVTIDKRV